MYTQEMELLKSGLVSRAARRNLRRLFAFFRMEGKELFLVGGCVRDLLLGRKPKDYDLCTNITPAEAKELVERYGYNTYDSGIKHGTITILDPKEEISFELTTYRCDGVYSDGRHPDEVTYVNSLEEDLKRRDFTINSFAYDLLDKQIYMLDASYLDDLKFGFIRAVGNPEERFKEDALRMMRAIRFMAQLGFNIDTETYNAILKLHPNIKLISKERIRDELTKIIMSDNPQMLELLVATNLEYYMFDGGMPIHDMVYTEHQNPWHYATVFHHTVDVIKTTPKKFEVRWAAFLHDIGKPAVKKLKPGTTDHYRYIGHPEASVEIAGILMDKLRFSNDEKDLIRKYIKYHDMDLVACKMSKFKTVLTDIGEENFLDFIKLKQADAMAHNLVKDTKFAIPYINTLYERYNTVINNKMPVRIRDLAVNGNDLRELGLEGKEIGQALNYLLTLVLEDASLNTKDTLLTSVKKYKENN